MEIRSIHIKTSHDLRPLIKLMDLTEETPDAIMLLIGIGAARCMEMAAYDNNDEIIHHAKAVIEAVEQIGKDGI